MEHSGLDRRNFLKMAGIAGVAVTVSQALPKFSWAGVKTVSFDTCMEMSAEDTAKASKMVMDSWTYIHEVVASIHNRDIRNSVQDIVNNPAPTFTQPLLDSGKRQEVFGSLSSQGFIPKEMDFSNFLPKVIDPQKSPHPFYAGPGSGYSSHHSYPGGLVSHTALNTMMALAFYENYRVVYGCDLDRDMIIASQVLHDLHKPWVFQWQQNGESRTEMKLAGTGEHHTYGIAESLERGLPADVCVAQACAHNHPGWAKDESGPVNWIKAAAILVGKDPVKEGLLAPDGKSLPLPRRMENFICHLGDHDWVLSVPAAKWLIPIMEEVAVEKYGMTTADLRGRKFNQLRNYVFAQASIMNLYEVYSTKGKDALSAKVSSMVAV